MEASNERRIKKNKVKKQDWEKAYINFLPQDRIFQSWNYISHSVVGYNIKGLISLHLCQSIQFHTVKCYNLRVLHKLIVSLLGNQNAYKRWDRKAFETTRDQNLNQKTVFSLLLLFDILNLHMLDLNFLKIFCRYIDPLNKEHQKKKLNIRLYSKLTEKQVMRCLLKWV